MLLFLIFSGSFAISLFFVMSAKVLREDTEEAEVSPAFVLAGTHLVSAGIMGLFWAGLVYGGSCQLPNLVDFWAALFATVFLNLLAKLFLFRAYPLIDVAMIAPFSGLSPVLAIFGAWLVLGELPEANGWLGIFLVSVSVYFLYTPANFNLRQIFKPFSSIFQNRGALLGFLSIIPPAFSIAFDKMAVLVSDPVTFSFFAVLGVGVGAAGIELYETGEQKVKKAVTLLGPKMLPLGALHCVATFFFTFALQYDLAPHISALKRMAVIFQMLLAYWLLDQRSDMKKRVFGGIGVVIGVLFIAMP